MSGLAIVTLINSCDGYGLVRSTGVWTNGTYPSAPYKRQGDSCSSMTLGMPDGTDTCGAPDETITQYECFVITAENAAAINNGGEINLTGSVIDDGVEGTMQMNFYTDDSCNEYDFSATGLRANGNHNCFSVQQVAIGSSTLAIYNQNC
jgi:hypothetical protein